VNIKKIYQLIISRLDGRRICDRVYQEGILALVRKGIGGFIIFGGKRKELRPFIDRLQTIAEIPLFIASDIERGVGQQIDGYTKFPCQMAVRAAINRDDPADITILRNALSAVALEAIDAGINMPLIPVLDVNSNPDNPIICTRAFSDNPDDVSFFGSEYIEVLEGMGLISCAKHFPGHGDTSTDSHISLPLITKSYNVLVKFDIRPFAGAIKTGVSSIMIGHLLIPSIDESNPSSLSKRVITGILRTELGFNGLIMTDALNMSALSSIENVSARCLNAGVDIILHPSDAELTVRDLDDAVRTELISEETIDVAVGRILKAKSRISRIKLVEVDTHSNTLISKRMAEMSITVINKKEGILPVADDDKIQVLIVGENRLCKQSLWGRQFRNVHSLTEMHENSHPHFFDFPQDRMGNMKIPLNPPFSKGENRFPPLEKGGFESGFSDEAVIIAIFSEIAAWRGSAGIDDNAMEQVIGLIRKARTSIVISFGSPYILRHFSDADVRIAAYEGNSQAQEAVIKCMKGETSFRGRLPVKI